MALWPSLSLSVGERQSYLTESGVGLRTLHYKLFGSWLPCDHRWSSLLPIATADEQRHKTLGNSQLYCSRSIKRRVCGKTGCVEIDLRLDCPVGG